MKINVHGGHSLKCRGAKSYLDEVNEDRKIKDEVIRLLRAEGHTVYDCTDDVGSTQNANLKNIVAKCNAHVVDLDVSIHLNASEKDTGNGKVKGTETFIYSSSSKTKAYAERVQANMKSLGFTNRGVKTSTSLYVLRKTNSPSMLVEVCFVDDYDDYVLYQNVGCKAVAKAIAEAILNKTVTEVKVQPTPTPQPSQPSGTSVNYQVKVTADSGLNCRATPSTSGAKVTAYAKGTVLTITKEQNGFGYTGQGWVALAYTSKVTNTASKPATSSTPTYKVGGTYTLQTELKVRTGAGTNYRAKKHSELSVDGRKHDKDGDGALEAGTKVTCKEVIKNGNDIWLKTPSGFLAAYYNGKVYIK